MISQAKTAAPEGSAGQDGPAIDIQDELAKPPEVSEDEEKVFDTWMAERNGKNGIVFLPRIKEIKLTPPEETQEE